MVGLRGISGPLVIAMAANGEAIAVVLGGVAVAVTVITVTTQGASREAEDNQLKVRRTCLRSYVLDLNIMMWCKRNI